MLLAVGAARSGTGFYASEHQLAWENNFPARVATVGMCSWFMGAWLQPGYEHPHYIAHAPIPDGWQPSTVVHLVRHPVRCIPSLSTLAHVSREWAAQYVDVCPYLPGLEWGARYWVAWNRLVRSQWWGVVPGHARVVRVEELEARRTPTDYNSRPHARYTAGELERELGGALWAQVAAMAEQLCYEPTRPPV